MPRKWPPAAIGPSRPAKAILLRTWKPWYRLVGHRRPLDRPVFIVGAHRSGTSLLARLLGHHADLAHWSEAPEVWDPSHWNGRSDLPYFIGRDVHRYRRGPEAVTEADRRRVHGLFGFYVSVLRKRRLLNKSPYNSMRIPWVKALFPDCRVVHIYRDGRAVVSSWKGKVEGHVEGGRYRNPPRDADTFMRALAETWVEVTRQIETSAGRLRPDEFLALTYEALCDDAHGELRKLFAFCELDPARYDWSPIPRRFENRNYKWKQALSPREQAIMLETIGARLAELGYEAPTA